MANKRKQTKTKSSKAAKTQTEHQQKITHTVQQKKLVPRTVLKLVGPYMAKRYFFAWISLFILLLTTVLWSYLGATTNQGNADQLIGPYLFKDTNTLEQSLLQSEQTQIIKWPLFLAIKALGFSAAAYIAVTVALTVVTIALFALLLYKIERRPAVFGLLCLSLASVLLLVPNQAVAGEVSTVGMAIISGRSIEYIIYIAALVAIVKSRGLRSFWAWIAVVVLGVLIASDRLFAVMSMVGVILSGVSYIVLRRQRVTWQIWHWITATVMATIFAGVLIGFMHTFGVAHFVNTGSGEAFGLAKSASELVTGLTYAILGVLTNMGANPVFDSLSVKDVPARVIDKLASPSGLGYVVNFLTLLAGLLIATKVILISFRISHDKRNLLDGRSRLTLMMIWSSLAMVALMALAGHEKLHSAQYLTITMFMIFICIAMYATRLKWHPQLAKMWAVVVLLAVFSGMFGAIANHQKEQTAMVTVNARNASVAEAISSSKSTLLVGDYWRVVPTKINSDSLAGILPVSECTKPRLAQTSRAWNKDLSQQSFAYLLSFDKNMTDQSVCAVDKVIEEYGQPNTTVVIDGTLEEPKEMLLLYERTEGNILRTSARTSTPNTLLPGAIGELIAPSCLAGRTVMNIVAHEDDDLLFMNPDLMNNIKVGNCVRTVFLTAGDAGSGNKFYWLGREQGAKAAYDEMMGSDKEAWVDQTLKLGDGQFVTVSTPQGKPQVSLIFVRLPDGNLRGEGFAGTRNESLESLEKATITKIHSVDGQSSYSYQQLIDGLSKLLNFYKPLEINSQADSSHEHGADHSDHNMTGRYVRQAINTYGQVEPVAMNFYLGYPIRGLPINVFDNDVIQKRDAFFSYGKHDGAVCASSGDCSSAFGYYDYLERQYISK